MTMTKGSGSQRRRGISEVTRWDLFVCVAGRPEGISLARLAHVMRVDRERSLIVPLGSLEEEGLLVCDSRDHYILSPKPLAQELRTTLSFALAYGYDYNVYLTDEMAEFLKKAYRSDYFMTDDLPVSMLKPELLCRLVYNDLLLIYQYGPFVGRLVDNPFLEGLCKYLRVKKISPFSFFKRKADMDEILDAHSKAVQKESSLMLKAAKGIFSGHGLEKRQWGLGEVAQGIRDSVEKEDAEMFDPASSACFQKAWDKMHEYVKRNVPLSIEVIKEYHQLCMANTNFGGVYRDHEVMIANNPNFKAAAIKEIPERLSELASNLSTAQAHNFRDALKICAYAYNEFIYTHPFQDGNSRTARIILAHLLNHLHMPFEKIPYSFEVRFLMVTKGLKKRDDNELRLVLEEIYLNCLNRQELGYALGQPLAAAASN